MYGRFTRLSRSETGTGDISPTDLIKPDFSHPSFCVTDLGTEKLDLLSPPYNKLKESSNRTKTHLYS